MLCAEEWYTSAMDVKDEQGQLIEEMAELKEEVAQQNSLSWMFVRGMVYGVGFVIGSAIIATILIGLFSPWLADIPWVRDTFETGEALLR